VHPGDAHLFERATAGDADAMDQLLAQHLPQLHAFVRVRLGGAVRARESSMDVVQSVCRELLAAPGAFSFQGEERFRAWLFTAALNKIRDKQRFHGRDRRALGREQELVEDDAAWRHAASLLTPSVDAIGGETARALAAAMAALAEEHREVITMARIVGLPHAVIAEAMGRSEQAVRQLLVRALLKLSAELRARGVDLRA
jgi:RNA polymerase sigma-70 factor, ECF subfamily